jgi:hypothetical protein
MDQLKRMKRVDTLVGGFCILIMVAFFGLVFIASITHSTVEIQAKVKVMDAPKLEAKGPFGFMNYYSVKVVNPEHQDKNTFFIRILTENPELKVGQLMNIRCLYEINNGVRNLIWAWDEN